MHELKDIAILGAGGLGKEVAQMICSINEIRPTWNLIGFFDDNISKGKQISHYGSVLGSVEDANNWNKELALILCIGNPKILWSIISKLNNQNLTFPNIVSPDFSIEDKETFSIGCGNIIKSQCKVTVNVKIGNFNILNGYITIGHDVVIKDYNVFMPGVRISGEVTIDYRNLFGCMSFVKQCIKVGNDITLSPLSPLLSRPKDGKTYIGNPARIFKY